MFCKKCGNELSNNAKFCSKCGNPSQILMMKLWQSADNDKVEFIKKIRTECNLGLKEAKTFADEFLETLDNNQITDTPILTDKVIKDNAEEISSEISNPFIASQLSSEELLDLYKRIRIKVNDLLDSQELLDKAILDLEENKKKEDKIRNKMGIVGNTFSILGLLIIVVCLSNGFWAIIMGILVALVIGGIGVAIDSKITKDKYIIQADEFHENVVELSILKVDNYKEKIEQIWSTDEMSLYEKCIPEEYSSLGTIDFFIRALEIGRATNQKELINLYEEETHRRRIEANQSRILSNQEEQLEASKQQTKQLKDISKKQRKISRQVKYGNTVSTLDYLFKK